MGSFQHTTFEEIAKATVVNELRIPTQREVLPYFSSIGASTETWAVTFAPDYSYVAWSCGNRVVKLVPWDKENKNLYNNRRRGSDETGSQEEPSNNNTTTPTEQPPTRDVVTIPCKDLVWSLAFGWSKTGTEKKSSSSTEGTSSTTSSTPRFGILDHSDDLILAIGLKSGKIKTYNVRKATHLLLVDHKSVVRDLKFTQDGTLRLVSASYDATLKVWDLQDNGNMVASLKGHPKAVHGCAISPDASLVASVGEQRSVIVWDFKKYKILRKLQGHNNHVTSCGFSVDGAFLATASYDSRVILWDPYTGEILSQFSHVFPILTPVFSGGSNGHYVRDIAFSPNGMHFATVCDDNLVRVWDISDNSDPLLVSSLQEALCCAFTPDGSVLVAGTRTGSLQFMAVPQRLQSLQHLCRMARRKSAPDTRHLDKELMPTVLKSYMSYRNLNREPASPEQ